MTIDLDLTKRDWAGVSLATLLLLAVVVFGRLVIGSLAIGIALILGISLILLLLLQNRRETLQNRRDNSNTFEQTEALLGIYSGLEETTPPLPRTRGWAASPDYLRLVYKQIRKKESSLVVELGSGSSTIVGGYALRKNGSGSIISFEHLQEYAHQSREEVSLHGLDNHCRVLESPLENYRLNGREWRWYSLEKFDPEESIGLVIVDGPPGHLQELSRYPALPLLSNYLSEEATFIVDDGDREDEEAMVEKWMEESQLEAEYVKTEKGAYLLKKK